MRGAIRRPTGDGVLDYTREFQMPGPRLSGNFGILVPLHYPPHGPAHSAGRTLKNVADPPFLASDNASKISLIFNAILAPKMVPEASQNPFKIDAKIH